MIQVHCVRPHWIVIYVLWKTAVTAGILPMTAIIRERPGNSRRRVTLLRHWWNTRAATSYWTAKTATTQQRIRILSIAPLRPATLCVFNYTCLTVACKIISDCCVIITSNKLKFLYRLLG